MPHRTVCGAFVACCLLGTLLMPSAALAQGNPITKLLGMSKASPAASTASQPAAGASAPPSDDERRARLLRQVEEVRALAADLERAPPAGISADELAQASRRLTMWALGLQAQLRSLASIAEASADRDAAFQAARVKLAASRERRQRLR